LWTDTRWVLMMFATGSWESLMFAILLAPTGQATTQAGFIPWVIR
jgi:hypothetical protein